jgi:hypothetical protein
VLLDTLEAIYVKASEAACCFQTGPSLPINVQARAAAAQVQY